MATWTDIIICLYVWIRALKLISKWNLLAWNYLNSAFQASFVGQTCEILDSTSQLVLNWQIILDATFMKLMISWRHRYIVVHLNKHVRIFCRPTVNALRLLNRMFLGYKCTVRGRHLLCEDHAAVVTMNHQSSLDALGMSLYTQCGPSSSLREPYCSGDNEPSELTGGLRYVSACSV